MDADIFKACCPGGSHKPAQLRVDGDKLRRERPYRQRREARGRGRGLQVAQVRLERRALELTFAQNAFDPSAERPRSGADLTGCPWKGYTAGIMSRFASIGSPSAVPVP